MSVQAGRNRSAKKPLPIRLMIFDQLLIVHIHPHRDAKVALFPAKRGSNGSCFKGGVLIYATAAFLKCGYHLRGEAPHLVLEHWLVVAPMGKAIDDLLEAGIFVLQFLEARRLVSSGLPANQARLSMTSWKSVPAAMCSGDPAGAGGLKSAGRCSACIPSGAANLTCSSKRGCS